MVDAPQPEQGNPDQTTSISSSERMQRRYDPSTCVPGSALGLFTWTDMPGGNLNCMSTIGRRVASVYWPPVRRSLRSIRPACPAPNKKNALESRRVYPTVWIFFSVPCLLLNHLNSLLSCTEHLESNLPPGINTVFLILIQHAVMRGVCRSTGSALVHSPRWSSAPLFPHLWRGAKNFNVFGGEGREEDSGYNFPSDFPPRPSSTITLLF